MSLLGACVTPAKGARVVQLTTMEMEKLVKTQKCCHVMTVDEALRYGFAYGTDHYLAKKPSWKVAIRVLA